MKPTLTLLLVVCLACPVIGQNPPGQPTPKDTEAEKTMEALKGLQAARAILKDKNALARLKAEEERPNYGGNAAAKARKNLWLAILEGKALPAPTPPAKSGD